MTRHPLSPLFWVLISAAFAIAAGAHAQEPLGRAERCIRLHAQLDAALAANREAETQYVAALRRKAIDLCARGKASQGARTFAKALDVVGRAPFAETGQSNISRWN